MTSKTKLSAKPVVGRRPKKNLPDAGTRDAILSAARKVFAVKGFSGTSTRDVAEAAGVNNAMIYYHFKDKNDLYRAVFIESFKMYECIWDDEIFLSAASTRSKIRKFVEEMITFQQSNDEMRKIMSMEFTSGGKNHRWLADNLFRKGSERLARILREGMRRGELRKVDPIKGSAVLYGMIIHSFMMKPMAEYMTGKSFDLSVRRFGGFITDLFFDGLGTNGPRRGKLKSEVVR